MRITDRVVNEIRARLPLLELRENEPMSAHCSFRIGGPARLMALPSSAETAAALCRLLRELGVAPFVMGNGTNLLVSDRALDIAVVKMGDGMSAVAEAGGGVLRAQCGVPLARLAQKAQSLGLAGLEFAHGIPGTLGGAVSMNAGAYGGEIKDVVTATRSIGEAMEIEEKKGPEQRFAYRQSAFTGTACVVLESDIALSPGDPAEIQAKMRELSEKRRASQPLDIPSAGSTFKRPAGGFAAALIDQAGLKGYAVGGAQVSEKHAGFVVNRGGATFEDVISLIDHIRETVYKTSGIDLEPEVKIIRG